MPLFYLEVLEMRAILRAQGQLLDRVCGGVETLVDVNFIVTADEATIRLWEKALKITYKNKLTLDQRKHVIIGYIIGLGHIGETEIRGIVGQYTNGEVAVEFAKGVITVTVYGVIFDLPVLLDTLIRRIPAHLGLIIVTELSAKTPAELRIGGAFGTMQTLPVPEAPDGMKWKDEARFGGAAAILSVLPVPERDQRGGI